MASPINHLGTLVGIDDAWLNGRADRLIGFGLCSLAAAIVEMP